MRRAWASGWAQSALPMGEVRALPLLGKGNEDRKSALWTQHRLTALEKRNHTQPPIRIGAK